MAPEKKAILPKHQRMLQTLGENLRLARLRRHLSAAMVAERAGISRNTLYELEKWAASSSISTLFLVLFVLGLEQDILLLPCDLSSPVMGRFFQTKKEWPRHRGYDFVNWKMPHGRFNRLIFRTICRWRMAWTSVDTGIINRRSQTKGWRMRRRRRTLDCQVSRTF